jgi:hypothetical protein
MLRRIPHGYCFSSQALFFRYFLLLSDISSSLLPGLVTGDGRIEERGTHNSPSPTLC